MSLTPRRAARAASGRCRDATAPAGSSRGGTPGRRRRTPVIGDRACDSDALDEELLEYFGVKLISPHRTGRRRPNTQDGRELRRYRHRWKVERLFAWLLRFRRIVRGTRPRGASPRRILTWKSGGISLSCTLMLVVTPPLTTASSASRSVRSA
ncbi:MAG: transposase [Myxococcales bacterium]|nr:transposase [Myxococcales bacterium]